MELTIQQISDRLAALELEAEKARAYRDCHNIMSTYSYYHSASRHKEYMGLWAKRDDCTLEMPWGIYDGYDSIYKCYVVDHGSREDMPKERLYGRDAKPMLFMHHLDTTVLVVADDAMTARGAWLSPGHATGPDFEHEDQFKASWQFSKYGVDFIKEDGVWKIWHMRVYPLFKGPVGEDWGKAVPFRMDDYIDSTMKCDRLPSEVPFGFRKGMSYPADQPDPPKAYRTFADVGESFFKELNPKK